MLKEKNGIRQAVLLVILDGYGVNPSRLNNGVAEANTPNFDRYYSQYPHTVIEASGQSVGLPDGQMGNSEVGHMTMGCGTILRQDLVKINEAIADGSFKKNPVLIQALTTAKKALRPIHLLGLVSSGGVHSHISHLYALLDMCKRYQVEPVVHVITDGRDTAPNSFKNDLSDLERHISNAGGRIATVSGRFYAMDRDNRWDRIQKAWQAIVMQQGETALNCEEVLKQVKEKNSSDEFIEPTVINGGFPVLPDDNLIFFNFRKDRTRQITSSLYKKDFKEFDRGDFKPIIVTCMTEYDQWYGLPFAFEQDRPEISLASHISRMGLKQFHCAETEKYAHVTFFFNGGQGEEFSNEDRKIVPSPKVETYDLCPEMSAKEVADETITAVKSNQYAFIVVNFANGDMVGHTAVKPAILKAIETLDFEVGRLLDVAIQENYSIILTADHGNCDEIIDPITGQRHTQHTLYPVPCLVIDKTAWHMATGKGLSNIAPTVLQLMGLEKPTAMSATSLLLKPIPR
ncbi:MAG: 2,3-bisphosphoglycerate-independent phosphoglycerate mutase [Thiohalomonadales bacterium]